MAKKKFYAVKKGYNIGIYESWSTVEPLVKGYSGAKFKSFFSRDEAQTWLEGNGDMARRPASKKKSNVSVEPGHHGAEILIYTDGGAINNPGPGGYGVVILTGTIKKEFQGGYRLTTNNRMELKACIVALQQVQESSLKIVLYSDSSYVVNGLSKGWVKKWKKNGWLTADKKQVLNRDLWQELHLLYDKLDVDFRWVKGHAGNPLNERCDQLAVQSARGTSFSVDTGYEES